MGVLVLMDQVFWVRSTDCSPANPSARTTNKVRCATVIPAMCGGRSVGVIGNVALIRRGGSTVSGLPSFLGFLFLEGLVEVDFSQAALAVHRRQSSLPRGIAKSEVQAILRSCDRRSALGRRDYAMVLLLVRLGLRRGEVAALRLDDIDWRAIELVVRARAVARTAAASSRRGAGDRRLSQAGTTVESLPGGSSLVTLTPSWARAVSRRARTGPDSHACWSLPGGPP
jgi:integrase